MPADAVAVGAVASSGADRATGATVCHRLVADEGVAPGRATGAAATSDAQDLLGHGN